MTDQIPSKESLKVEFKSDRKKLSDRDLIEAVVCLANTQGGQIYLGVENDGTSTCRIGPYQATRLLDKLVQAGCLERYGQRRGTYYRLKITKK